jgi:hypothetical protein
MSYSSSSVLDLPADDRYAAIAVAPARKTTLKSKKKERGPGTASDGRAVTRALVSLIEEGNYSIAAVLTGVATRYRYPCLLLLDIWQISQHADDVPVWAEVTELTRAEVSLLRFQKCQLTSLSGKRCLAT